MHDLDQLPPDLPRPLDDGACDHLARARLPSIALPATTGGSVDLSTISGGAIVFAYPRTGRPGEAPFVEDWDSIPGARGCTPQASGFRDLAPEFAARGYAVFGLSTQDTPYQREMAQRLRLPFPVLSDEALALAKALRLPTFEVNGHTLLKRLSWIARDGTIERVFYPVFPPNESASVVLSALKAAGAD